jgi:sulfatase modifying factor 1
MRPTLMCLCGLLIFVGATMSGCGEEDPGPEPTQVGTITINQEPDGVNASWQLLGPGEFSQSGTGDLSLADLTTGDYTLTWGTVVGWTTPNPATVTQPLVEGGTLTFTGTYVAYAGTITINPEPNSIDAPWEITGPAGFSQSGTGDLSLADMTAGDYTLTWGAVPNWTTPSPAVVTQPLAVDGTLTFSGVYIQDAGVPLGFVSIDAGTFTMGSPADEPGHDPWEFGDETQHQVTLTHGIYIQTAEVTNQQYMELAQWAYDHGHCTATSASLRDALDGSIQELLKLDGGYCEISFSGGTFTVDVGKASHPVMNVTWYGSVAYCDWLSLQQGLPRAYDHATWQCNGGNPYTAAGYRLPTEAEWEYACRAGTQTAYNTGACLDAGTEANYDGGYPQADCSYGPYVGWTVPVGSYPPNGYGLLDMHGNVYEWCNDWYGMGTDGGVVTDPAGPGAGYFRVLRGGSFGLGARHCRSAERYYNGPSYAYHLFGFRSVRSSN